MDESDPSTGEHPASMIADDLELDVNVDERIHIAPLGYERDRVIIPALEMGADRVILITHIHDSDADRPAYYQDIFDAFEEHSITVTETECDLFDLYDSLGTIAALIQKFNSETVRVNLATGGKVTAIAGMIACMVTEAATPYYVSAAEYGDHQDTPVAETVTNISQLPTYPIDAPSKDQIQILEQLYTEGSLSKQDLIEYAEAEELAFIAAYEGTESKGKYRKLDAKILEPLESDGYVRVREQGRKKLVKITDEGAKTLEAFQYMLDT